MRGGRRADERLARLSVFAELRWELMPGFAGQRGSCSWQWMQGGYGTMMNRCYGEASVWCD
jgi:hypothetical protein